MKRAVHAFVYNRNLLKQQIPLFSRVSRQHSQLNARHLAPQPCEGAIHQATIVQGRHIAETVCNKVKEEVSALKTKTGCVPGLAVVLVGNRQDSRSYVNQKRKAAAQAGIESYVIHLPQTASEEDVIQAIERFNEDGNVHGILVQLPLPNHIREDVVLNRIDVNKDVDGLNPWNMGLLGMRKHSPFFTPCTPKGIIEVLDYQGIEIAGKHAVVIGCSNIVGLPVSLMLKEREATVTICHAMTKDLKEIVKQADILVAACGQPELVRGDWLKKGVVVLDVGMNPVPDPSSKRGFRYVGDVCFPEAVQVAGVITPVPGGIGPMTIAMLLANTVHSAQQAILGGNKIATPVQVSMVSH